VNSEFELQTPAFNLFDMSHFDSLKEVVVFKAVENNGRFAYPPRTYPKSASVIWKLFMNVPNCAFSRMLFLLKSTDEFLEVRQFAKLVEFPKAIEVRFGKGTLVLHIV
jgi:hypothetical protein